MDARNVCMGGELRAGGKDADADVLRFDNDYSEVADNSFDQNDIFTKYLQITLNRQAEVSSQLI